MHWLAISVVPVALTLPEVAGAQQSAVNYQTPDGREVQIVINAQFPKRVQTLVAGGKLKRGLPVLHQGLAMGGKVASLIKGNSLVVWHAPAGGRQDDGVTRATIRLNKSGRAITPKWWPRLQNPWSRRATDQHSVTTTLMGWASSGVAATRARITASANRAGLSHSELGQNDKPAIDGDFVFFTGPGREMMVTFSRIGGQTGVVAHFTETKR